MMRAESKMVKQREWWLRIYAADLYLAVKRRHLECDERRNRAPGPGSRTDVAARPQVRGLPRPVTS